MTIKVLIIGAGPAGLAAAEAAVSLGASVTLCGAENYPPYWRPRLTRCLSEPVSADKLAIHKQEWYAQHSVPLTTGKVAERIDLSARQVFWQEGEATPFDALVLAMGSYPNIPPIPGVESALSLRSYDDAVEIRREALSAGKAVVVGGGLLGLETAWELNSIGVKVTLLERNPWLIPRQLDRRGGEYLQKMLESSGLELIVGRDPAELVDQFKGAAIICAAGVCANLSLARNCGISTGRGITVDNHMRTSAQGVYACGDVAEFMGRSWGLLPMAQEQGRVAGLNAAGGEATYVEMLPSPMLKIGSVPVFSVGDVAEAAGVVTLREEDETGYVCLMLREDVLVGAVLVGNTAPGMKLRKTVTEKRSFAGIKNVKDAIAAL